MNIVMINPFKFIQGVKQEAFKVTWPTGKETLTGALMVVLLSIVAAIFFLILDQILKFLLNVALTISF
jgi:preprotein translocase subunit SecE